MDLTLIHRSQAGDQDAFALLFDQHKNLVFRTAVLTLGDAVDAEDILQEVFLQVHRSISSYDPSRAAFTTWLYRITVNKCLNWRRGRAETRSLEKVPESVLHAPRETEAQQAERDAIQQVLGRLNRKLRLVIILRHYWDLSYAEIANILDLPLGTVKSRLNLAMRKLHDDLKNDTPPRAVSMEEAPK